MAYTIMCRVSGGSTGTHESRLRNARTVVVFPTHEAAQARADDLTRSRNDHPHQRADFKYWVADDKGFAK